MAHSEDPFVQLVCPFLSFGRRSQQQISRIPYRFSVVHCHLPQSFQFLFFFRHRSTLGGSRYVPLFRIAISITPSNYHQLRNDTRLTTPTPPEEHDRHSFPFPSHPILASRKHRTISMNTHHANPHVPRRNRHLFDPSRIKIGIEDIRERGGVEGGVEEACGGEKGLVQVQVQVQEDEGRGMMKRQWHDPWTIAVSTHSPTTITSPSSSSCLLIAFLPSLLFRFFRCAAVEPYADLIQSPHRFSLLPIPICVDCSSGLPLCFFYRRRCWEINGRGYSDRKSFRSH